MSNLGPNAIFYLAAAVSDFYVPWQSMVGVNYTDNLFEYRVKKLRWHV